MSSQTGTQIITIHKFLKKSNQTMKFGQLLKHNMRAIFLSKIKQKSSQSD